MKKLTKTSLAAFLKDVEKSERNGPNYDDGGSSSDYSEGIYSLIEALRREFGIQKPDPESLKPPLVTGEIGVWEHYVNHKNPIDNDLYFELQVFNHLQGKVGEFYGAGWWAPSFYALKEKIAEQIERSGITADRIEIQQMGKDAITGHPYGVIIITP